MDRLHTIFSAGVANGAGDVGFFPDDEILTLLLDTSGSANLTIKIYGSDMDTPPTFTSAQSATNQYAPLGFYNEDSGDFIAGSTGIVLSGADVNKKYRINTSGARWINLVISSYVAGTVVAKIRAFNPSK